MIHRHDFSSVVGHCGLKFAYFSGLTLFCDNAPTVENLNYAELLSVLGKKSKYRDKLFRAKRVDPDRTTER